MYKNILQKANNTVRKLQVKGLIEEGFLPANGQGYPSIIYPPVTRCGDMTEDEALSDYAPYSQGQTCAVYAHIPFCIQRCNFCHFVVNVEESNQLKDQYIDALDKEMTLFLDKMGLKKLPAKVVLVGGGTATNLTVPQLDRFCKNFAEKIDFSQCSTFTWDVDPTTLLGEEGRERLNILIRYGADRITIGAQSFDKHILKSMNRAHDVKDIVLAYNNAREAGFDNICFDLMYGYPGQNAESWIKTMLQSISLGVDSFQLYRFCAEPYANMPGVITKSLASDFFSALKLEEALLMKVIGLNLAYENGYIDTKGNFVLTKKIDQNHINNQDRDYCKFFIDTVGLGIASTNKFGDNISLKTSNIREFISKVAAGSIPFSYGEKKSEDTIARRIIVNMLRNKKRAFKDVFLEKTGRHINDFFKDKIEGLKRFSLVQEDHEKIEIIGRGLYFVDDICFQFYNPSFIPFAEDAYNQGVLNPYNKNLLEINRDNLSPA